MCLVPVTAGLWSRKCGRATVHFPGFNPIVELSLTFHNLVVGANGQRQAMFLENTVGLAERILRNFDVTHAGQRADHFFQRL